MEYILNKFMQLADSVLAPGWAWVMARSWMFRACVLASGGVIFLAWYMPEIVWEKTRLGISTFQVATNYQGHIPLDTNLSSTTKRLEKTLMADLTNFAGPDQFVRLVPWSAAQAIVAVEEGKQGTRPDYAQGAISRIRSNETGECFCWAEIPRKGTDEVAMIIAGWVMLAFSHLRETISDSEIAYILGLQQAEGWWPIFGDKTDEAFASTYSTAWIVLGLAEMSRRELISATMRPKVEVAVDRGVSWLYRTRTDSQKWKPYPNMADSHESYSISGLVLHTLHVADPSGSGLRDLDRSWLSGLRGVPPEFKAKDDEGQQRPELRGSSNIPRIDTFVQLKLPWMLIATVDAYSNGNILQKGRALDWINVALSKQSVLTADANTESWKRAELLYAIKYVRTLAAKGS